MIPFILRGRVELPPESEPSDWQVYDEHRQIWIDQTSGAPVVTCLQMRDEPTQFGETVVTATREGTDQSEISALRASPFGETTLTKTAEGTDQSEVSLAQTRFGETTLTETREGADQTEVAGCVSQFGETTITRSHEGHDQTELATAKTCGTVVPAGQSYAPHSHL